MANPTTIARLSPATAVAGSGDLTLTLRGTEFDGEGVIRTRVVWSVGYTATPLATAVKSPDELTALVPSGLLSAPGTARVQVEPFDTIEQTAGLRSNALEFRIEQLTVPPLPPMAYTGFAPTGSMTTPRSDHTATLLQDGRVLIVGGDDPGAELFDPATGTFAPTGSMGTIRFGATATLLPDGKVLLAGGYGPGVGPLPRLSSVELFDPATGSFRPTGSMADARVLHAATPLPDGRVLISGGAGEGGGGGAAIGSAEIFDPTTGTAARRTIVPWLPPR